MSIINALDLFIIILKRLITIALIYIKSQSDLNAYIIANINIRRSCMFLISGHIILLSKLKQAATIEKASFTIKIS